MFDNKYGRKIIPLYEIAIDKKYEIESGKGKTQLPFDRYKEICLLDPTTKNGNAGKYCNWLLSKVTDSTDLGELSKALGLFNDISKKGGAERNGLKADINGYKSVGEFIDSIKKTENNDTVQYSESELNNRERLKGQFKVYMSSQNWDIIMPLTWEAERYFGRTTEWCTVANGGYYAEYDGAGTLYINYPKNGDLMKLRSQFHFEKEEFANVYDHVIYNPKTCLHKIFDGVDKQSFNELNSLWKKDRRYNEYSYYTPSGALRLLKRGVAPDKIFDGIGSIGKIVCLNGEFNVLNATNDGYISEKWYDFIECKDADENYYCVSDETSNYNLLRLDGTLVFNRWFDFIGYVRNGIVYVTKNSVFNFYNLDKDEYVHDEWYKWVSPMKVDYRNDYSPIPVYNRPMFKISNNIYSWNFIKEGDYRLLSDEWFTRVEIQTQPLMYRDKNLIYTVQNSEGKWNAVTSTGGIVSPNMWFDNPPIITRMFGDRPMIVDINHDALYMDRDGILYPVGGHFPALPDDKQPNLNHKNESFKPNKYGRKILNETKLITEGYVDSYIEKLIKNNVRDDIKSYLNDNVGDIMRNERHVIDNTLSAISDIERNELVQKNVGRSFWNLIRLYVMRITGVHAKLRFYPGVMRIVFADMGLFRMNISVFDFNSKINKVRELIEYLSQYDGVDQDVTNLNNELDSLNGKPVNFSKLYLLFGDRMKMAKRGVRNKNIDKSYGNGDTGRYEKLVVTPENRLQLLGDLQKYTSWCIAFETPVHFDEYIIGGKRFYVFLRDDYKELKKEVGEGCPFDDYGMSMLAFLITPYGSISSLTTRWNHEHGGEIADSRLHDDEFLSWLQNEIGFNIFKECPPYAREELHDMGVVLFDEVQDMLDRGVKPEDIFDNIDKEKDGVRKVELNDKYNFLRSDNKLLSKVDWFEFARRFENGYSVVELEGVGHNLLKLDGTYHFDNWYYGMGIASKGIVKVSDRKDEWRYMDMDGNPIGRSSYRKVGDFYDERAWVEVEKEKYMFIDMEGRFINDECYDDVRDFHDGVAVVEKRKKYGYLKKDGTMLTGFFFNGATNFKNGRAVVTAISRTALKQIVNVIDLSGNVVYRDRWFDRYDDFIDNFREVRSNGEYNLLNFDKRELISDRWFSFINGSDGVGIAAVKYKGKWNFINEDGSYVSKVWFDGIGSSTQAGMSTKSGFHKVMYNGKYYIMDDNGIFYNDDYERSDVQPNMNNESVKNKYGRKLLKESILNESRADKLAKNFLKSKGVTDYNKQMEIIGNLKHDIPNLRNDGGKFVLGGLRCYYDHELTDADTIGAFDKALGYIFKGNHQNEYDENLNGMSAEQLTDRYKDVMKGDLDADIERSNKREFAEKSKYRIIPIETYEQASQYGKYTSWCVTHGEDAFDQYTGKGAKRFYFCLEDGFENVPKTAGENAPVDEYGLSMIAVLIDNLDGGSVDRVTTRWNHDHDGENNKNLCTAEQLENVLNVPFYKTFKPYTSEELKKRGIVPFSEVQGMLDRGVEFGDIFKKYKEMSNGMVAVELNEKDNVITKDRKLLLKRWVDAVYDFHNGFAKCNVHGNGFNYINENGEYISKTWFSRADDFDDWNIARVSTKEDGFNFIDTSGKILFDEWFKEASVFKDNYSIVKRKSDLLENVIDTNLHFLSDDWYNNISLYHEGVFKVYDAYKGFNYIDTDGKLISKMWFAAAQEFYDGIGVVQNKEKLFNYIDVDGELLSNEWFENAWPFSKGYGRVFGHFNGEDNGVVMNIMDRRGHLISKKGYKNIKVLKDGLFEIRNSDDMYNLMDKNGNLLCNDWYDDIDTGQSKYFLSNNKESVFMDKDGIFYSYQNGERLPDSDQMRLRRKNESAYPNKYGRKLLKESYLITEGRVGSYIKGIIFDNVHQSLQPYLNEYVGELNEKHPEILRNVLDQMDGPTANRFIDDNKNRRFWDLIRINMMNSIGVHSKSRFYTGAMRCAFVDYGLGKDFMSENEYGNRVNKLKEVLRYCTKMDGVDPDVTGLNDEIDSLNGKSVNAEALYGMFRKRAKELADKIRQENSTISYGNGSTGRYKKLVVTPENRKELLCSLQKYTSWCIAFDSPSNFDNYVSNGGRFYVFLRDDFKDIPENIGDDCPFDDYGMSMLSFLINASGAIEIFTTRWNHSNGGEIQDKRLVDDKFLSWLQNEIGFNIFKECPPYTKDELRNMGVMTVEMLQDELDSGADIEDFFSIREEIGVCTVVMYDYDDRKMNIIIDGKLIFPDWGYCVFDSRNNFIRVANDNYGYKIINALDGKFITNEWYRWVSNESDGFFVVRRFSDKLNNWIDHKGNYLTEDWFCSCGIFSCGVALVRNEKNLYNYINKDGVFILDRWCKEAHDFRYDYGLVEYPGKGYNYVDKDGRFLFDVFFTELSQIIPYKGKLVCNGKIVDNNKKSHYIRTDLDGNFYDPYGGAPIKKEDVVKLANSKNESVYLNKYGRKILNEGLIKSYPIDTNDGNPSAFSYLKKRFRSITDVEPYFDGKNPYWMSNTDDHYKGNTTYLIHINDVSEVDAISDYCDKTLGWLTIGVGVEDYPIDDWDAGRFLMFNKRFDGYFNRIINANIRDYFKIASSMIEDMYIIIEAKFGEQANDFDVLYHATEFKNLDRIRKYGLIPKTQGTQTERVYFSRDYKDSLEMLDNKFGKNNHPRILRLTDTSKYKFYEDPRDDGAVYTFDCIDPRLLEIKMGDEWFPLLGMEKFNV